AGAGYEFVNDIKGGSVPKEYIKPIDQGIRGAMELGILAGYPMVDVKVILFDGSYHEVDSNEMAFKFAGSIAFKEAARKASPVLLEPVMAVEVTVPEECAASFRREIRAHRGRVKSESTFSGLTEIRALIPLAELLHTNSSTLRQSPAAFSGYEQRPGDEADGPGITANTPHRPRSRQGYERIKPEDVDPY
ncbi:MAG TPA: elongation factor G, partial [Terracidiphilus sp.]|nr:elongation factor G [Terracidiphilus sp.]